ncbi:anthranilate synthase component I [Oceanobacillus manasiensis]|uniref:anthranilate synthase component I n=1 Tax=Oceanobacillus manasiensis TaxID=586413 RepID=UPI0005AB19F5|nr:anthranilate synthase component I [Oceanobacillus manasiensis]
MRKNGKHANYTFLKINADTHTPISIFQRLHGTKKMLLESSFKHETKGRYSYIACSPYKEVLGHNNVTVVKEEGHPDEEVVQEALTYLKENLPHLEASLPVPFQGGAIGYIAYDAIRQFESIGEAPMDELEMPDIHLMLYKTIIAFDHRNEEIYLIAMNPDQESEYVLNARLEDLRERLSLPFQDPEIDQQTINFQPEISQANFEEKVRVAKQHIERGDIFQVVLSQRMNATMDGEPFSFYRKLRKANPSPYMFYIDFTNYVLLGASPESLIQTRGNDILTNPIAGTRPRGTTEEKDQELMEDLLDDEKEIAEHRMLLDLGRNDLGRVCEIGSITLPTFMKVEKYQHVMHIVSEVKGTLKQGLSSIDALISCLPAGTVSGAPKIRAMQIINQLEETKRGVYAGGVGYIGFNKDINIALAIRSLVVKDGIASLQTGAGIVHDSIPENEFAETLNKAKSLMEVANIDLVTG